MLKNLFPKKDKKPKALVTDPEMEGVRRMIDDVLYPKFEKNLKVLNEHLKDQNIQVGMDITWIFQKIE